MRPDHHGGSSRVCLAWGRRGAQAAAERGDILIVIDTLRFSTAAATAVHHGALIYPCSPDEALFTALAERVGGEVARHSQSAQSAAPARLTLSPRSELGIEPGAHVGLPSSNAKRSTPSSSGTRQPSPHARTVALS